ncbi:MAG: GGDEF domain-containing protein [Myxococcales bacterium]|nr:GGDEF domain-containing protein [Myxococcales bacterium]
MQLPDIESPAPSASVARAAARRPRPALHGDLQSRTSPHVLRRIAESPVATAALVPVGLLVACLAAWLHHRYLLGMGTVPVAAFIVPGLLGIAAGIGAAWLLVALRAAESRADVDGLTRIRNRAAIEHALAQEVDRSARYGQPFGLVVFDVDHFKTVNDTHGHTTGDNVLLHITNTVGGVLRRTDVFGRWGGDEFVIIAPGTGVSGARALAEKVRAAVAASPGPRNLDVTVSVGVSLFVPGDDAESVLTRADEALYEAKRGGRNRAASTRCLRNTGTLAIPAELRAGAESNRP